MSLVYELIRLYFVYYTATFLELQYHALKMQEVFCRFTIDVLQKVKKEVTNSESCVTVKLLHQKATRRLFVNENCNTNNAVSSSPN